MWSPGSSWTPGIPRGSVVGIILCTSLRTTRYAHVKCTLPRVLSPERLNPGRRFVATGQRPGTWRSCLPAGLGSPLPIVGPRQEARHVGPAHGREVIGVRNRDQGDRGSGGAVPLHGGRGGVVRD